MRITTANCGEEPYWVPVLALDKINSGSTIDGNAPYSSRCTFNTTERTFSSSNINFYYVFYLALVSLIFFFAFSDGGDGGGVSLLWLKFFRLGDSRLILSTENTYTSFLACHQQGVEILIVDTLLIKLGL